MCFWTSTEHELQLRSVILRAIRENVDYVGELGVLDRLLGGNLNPAHYEALAERE